MGPLWTHSAFGFEAMIAETLKGFKGTKGVSQQAGKIATQLCRYTLKANRFDYGTSMTTRFYCRQILNSQ